uniref:T9SS type A sorting domain-containing protein n=1 Tax=Winogradskyella aurantiaca TaxID=2219558 RepID=UPI000E1C971B
FTEITTRDYEVHLTYNSDDGYIYTIDADNATYLERIDPVFGTGQIINLSAAGDEGPLNKVTAITYQGGQVYIGSDANDKVYVASFVDAMNAEYEFVADAPVSGGDLAFKDGRLFLATRSGNRLIRIDAGNTTTDVGSVPNKVTGLAVSEDNNFLTTNNNKNVVYELADDGTPIGNGYNVTGDLSVLKNGDFSSGCGDNGAGDPFCFVSEVVNPGAEINDIADNDGWEQYGPGELTAVGGGWDTTSSIEIQRSGSVNGVESHCDSGFHFELLSRAPQDNMYQVFSTDPGSLVHVVFYHKKRPGGSSEDTMQVEYGSDLNSLQLLGTHSVSADDGWARVEMSFTATSAQTVVLLRGVSGSTGSIGNLIDDVYVGCDADMAVEPCDSQGPPALVPHTGAYSDLMIAEDDITLYPVPAVSSLNIQVDNEGAPVEGSYYITSITGRVSHQGTIQINNGVQSSTVHESVESLPDGMYFLVMEVNGNRITKQFVKTNR